MDPQTKLHVEGTPDTVNATLRITATSECTTGISCNSTGTVIGTDTGGILFRTGVTANTPTTTGSERLRILSGGQVNIGGNYSQTTYTMQVTGTFNATGNITQNGNALATNGKAVAMALVFG